MPKTVVLPNLIEIEFPDDATTGQMNLAISEHYPELYYRTTRSLSGEYVTPQKKGTGEFFPSIARGIDQVQSAMGSGLDALGEATGWEGLEKYGEKVRARNQKELEEFEQVHPRLQLRDVKNVWSGPQSWVDYTQQALGEVAPSIGISLTGAAAGAVAGSFVPFVGTLVGGAIGAFLPSALMGTGEVQDTIKELDHGKEAPFAALAGGALIGALDIATLSLAALPMLAQKVGKKTIIQEFVRNGVKEGTAKGAVGTAQRALARSIKSFPKGRKGKALALGLIGTGTESITERLQEITAIEVAEAVTDKKVLNRAERVLEATVMGAIAGAGFGGGVGAITGRGFDTNKILDPESGLKVERGADDELILNLDPIAIEAYEKSLETEVEPQIIPKEKEEIIIPEVPEVGKPIKVYDPRGKEHILEVEAISEAGTVRVYDKKGNTHIVDSNRSPYSYANPKDPEFETTIYDEKDPEKRLLKISEMSDELLIERAQQLEKRTQAEKEGKQESTDTIRERNAIKYEQRRRSTRKETGEVQFQALTEDEKLLEADVKKNPIEWMSLIVRGDNDFRSAYQTSKKRKEDRTDQLEQLASRPDTSIVRTDKYLGDKLGTQDRNQVRIIKETLSTLKNPLITLVGKNKWKYTPFALTEKTLGAQYRRRIKGTRKEKILGAQTFEDVLIADEQVFLEEPELLRNGKRWKGEYLGVSFTITRKDDTITSKKKPFNVYSRSLWIHRIQTPKGGYKLSSRSPNKLSDRIRTQYSGTSNLPSNAARIFSNQISNIKVAIEEEYPTLRAEKFLEYPMGVSELEQFQISTASKNLFDAKKKIYKTPKAVENHISKMRTELDHKTLELENMKKPTIGKQQPAYAIQQQNIKVLEDEVELINKNIQDREDILTGIPRTRSIAVPLSDKDIATLMTNKERKKIIAQEQKNPREKAAKENLKAIYKDSSTGNKTQKEQGAKDLVNDDPKNIVAKTKGAMERINLYEKWMNSTVHLANKYPIFIPFYRAVRRYDETFRAMVGIATRVASAYASLTKVTRPAVNEFILLSGQLGIKPVRKKNTDGTYNLTLTIPLYYSFKEWGVVKNEEGKPLTDPKEIEARIAEAPKIYTTEYFQKALDMAMGGKQENEKLWNWKINDTRELSDPNQIKAVEGMQIALAIMWQNYMKQLIKATGNIKINDSPIDSNLYDNLMASMKSIDDGNPILDTEKNPITTLSGLIRQKAVQLTKEDDKVQVESFEGLATVIEKMEAQKNNGYFPSVREGDGFIRIYKTVKIKDKKGKVRTETDTYYRVDIIQSVWDKWMRGGDFEVSAQAYLNKYMPNWRTDYPEEEGFKTDFVDMGQLTKLRDTGDDALNNMEAVEKMLVAQDLILTRGEGSKVAQGESQISFDDLLKNLFKSVEKEKKNRGFLAHQNRRLGIPGSITPQNMEYYVGEGFSLYTAKASRFIARMETQDEINEAINDLRKQLPAQGLGKKSIVGENLLDKALHTRDFVFSPQSALAFFKTIAFNGFLGGNISSVMVNFSQNFVAAQALHGAYGPRSLGMLTKSFINVSAMVGDLITGDGTYVLYPLPAKGKLKNEWSEIERRGEEFYKKWHRRGLIESRIMYQRMVQVSESGAFGRINTEAIAENSDVTLNFLRKKAGVPEGAANLIGKLHRTLTTIYAGGEMINRMAAALATMRMVDKFGTQPLRNFFEGVPGSDRLVGVRDNPDGTASEEAFIESATMVSNHLHFNMDPHNRPRIAQIVGGVLAQFLPFVTMMIEIYGNALFGRYGKRELNFINDAQKQRMLIGMITQQLALGGLFALPFADDLDEVVKLISKATGMEKHSIYEIMYEYLVDDAGLSEDVATALLRGPLEGYGPISIGRRIALSPFQNVLRLRADNAITVPLKLIGGPAASFIEGWGQRIGGAAREGNWVKALMYLPPTALTTNIANAYYRSVEGIYTGTGRTLDDGLDGMDRLWSLIGFTTQDISRKRDLIRRSKHMETRMRPVRDRITDRLEKLYVLRNKASEDKADKYTDKIAEIWSFVIEHDAGKEFENKIDPTGSLYASVMKRLEQFYSPLPEAIATPPKWLQHRLHDFRKLPQ